MTHRPKLPLVISLNGKVTNPRPRYEDRKFYIWLKLGGEKTSVYKLIKDK